MRFSLWVFALGAALAVAGCGHGPGPRTFVLHAPLQPAAQQPVTYTAVADDPAGITAIEIWEERRALRTCRNGMPCATQIARSQLTACRFRHPAPHAECSTTAVGGYPDASLIGYGTHAVNARGRASDEGWVYFAAGAFPWPDLPVPVYVSRAPARSLDLVFIPDDEYAADPEVFRRAVTHLVEDGYFASAPFAREIRGSRGHWNLYVTYRPASVGGYPGCLHPPRNWTQLRTVVNAGAVLHRRPVRDCTGLGDGALSSLGIAQSDAPVMAVHATSHTLFALADEYCCDGAYWQTDQDPNVFETKSACRSHAAAREWPATACVEISPPSWWRNAGASGWFRSDPRGDLMEQIAGESEHGRSDQVRIQWLYRECDAGRC